VAARIEALEQELDTHRLRGETHQRMLTELRRASDDLLSRDSPEGASR